MPFLILFLTYYRPEPSPHCDVIIRNIIPFLKVTGSSMTTPQNTHTHHPLQKTFGIFIKVYRLHSPLLLCIPLANLGEQAAFPTPYGSLCWCNRLTDSFFFPNLGAVGILIRSSICGLIHALCKEGPNSSPERDREKQGKQKDNYICQRTSLIVTLLFS